MADKKDSELPIKSTIVDGDLIPLLDSETAVDEEKNKTVAAGTLKAVFTLQQVTTVGNTTDKDIETTGDVIADESFLGDVSDLGYGALVLKDASVVKVLIIGEDGGHSYIQGTLSVGTITKAGALTINQVDASGAIPALFISQTDVSEEMIEFDTTIGVGNAIEAVGAKTLTTTHFIKVTLPGGLTRYIPAGTIA